jgi:hypothetical protein
MRTPKELLQLYLSSPPAAAAVLFHSDGSLYLPYLASLDVEARYTGAAQIQPFLTFLHDQMYPGFSFDTVTIHMETDSAVFAEYHIHHRSGISGLMVHQHFFGYLTAEDGKIRVLTEALNSVAAAQAIFPGGIAGALPAISKAAASTDKSGQ